MENKNKTKLGGILFSGKAMSLLGLIVLTIALTFYFRVNKFENFFEEQKGSLLSFYTRSLQPLFLGREITREDIFNFAFYHELPLDRQRRQYLLLGIDSVGKQYVEFRNAPAVLNTNNLETFSSNLNLNSSQRRDMDSILNYYGDKIKAQILVNENNTVAINENLWSLNKALLADLFIFASKANKTRFRELIPAAAEFAENPELPKMLSEVKNANLDRFIFVTSDSVFSHDFKFDMGQFKKEAKNWKREADKDLRVEMKFERNYAQKMKTPSGRSKGRDIKVSTDPNRFRVEVPEIPEIPDVEAIMKQVEAATAHLKNLKINMHPPVVTGGKHKPPSQPETPPEEGSSDDKEDFELNIELPDVDSIIDESLNEDKTHRLKRLPTDSQGTYMYGNLDSLDRARIKEGLQKAREELKKLKRYSNKKNAK
ncbi:MAG: hypothetical protein HF314_02705 [Ignavibacteria bacterium]|jgi:hypothetical protein|nr:hypothetical protein [Ignavibacteria bacterium]MCU7501958.1 hypothetical protein [Ignavibacteria bacterium]MCU7516926.1 hypothetical protein [Ignavibacteria bacterium]